MKAQFNSETRTRNIMISLEDLAEWVKRYSPKAPITINRRILDDAAGHRSSDDALHILTQLSGRQWAYDPQSGEYTSPPPVPCIECGGCGFLEDFDTMNIKGQCPACNGSGIAAKPEPETP